MLHLNLFILYTVFILECGDTFGATYPKDLPKCHYNDSECVRDAIRFILSTYPHGHPKLYLESFEPIVVDSVQIIQEIDQPININLTISDLRLYGFSNSTITAADGFGKLINENQIKIHAIAPKLICTGDYEINGKILGIPIIGKGESEFIAENFDILFRFTPITNMERDKVYLKTNLFTVVFDLTALHLDFKNLFGGNKILSDEMNLFVNENWRAIIEGLRPAANQIFSRIFSRIFDRFFSKFPYNELFIE